MSRKILDIPYWGIFLDCFPDQIAVAESQNINRITPDQWWTIARWWRDALLNESDWSQVPDNSLSEESKEEWRKYRQELRDISKKYSDPRRIVFPSLPNKKG